MTAGHLLIESGDTIQRRIPNGAEETYLIIDPGYSEAVGCVPANYQIEVKCGSLEYNGRSQYTGSVPAFY